MEEGATVKEVTEYGKLQRDIRNEAKMSIRELAERSGVSHSYLSQVENGTRSTPSKEIIKKVADALNYNYFDLAVLGGVIDRNEITLENLKEFSQDLWQQHNSLMTTKAKIEDIISDMKKRGTAPEELIKDNNQLDEQILNLEKEMNKIEEKIQILSEGNGEKYDIVLFDEEGYAAKQYIRFSYPKYQKVDIDGEVSSRKISEDEAREQFLSLEYLLSMDEEILLNKKVLSQYDKERALKILQLVFQKEQE
ncbi:hypothetical protein CSV61_16030 [Sporosarcina sp. P3]|uniref:helix-turn-helix domain-containing protein n=1 Tax=Sporosarcina sp. P3 TaxID=2048245 RepID=UPI000C1648A5|nr:helix-turn-helix transcriptional regulator [Sporosarcina sp. P3]PID20157.1 hypothetical protein CSV61_16030 [Sporosarcina sp. P3]